MEWANQLSFGSLLPQPSRKRTLPPSSRCNVWHHAPGAKRYVNLYQVPRNTAGSPIQRANGPMYAQRRGQTDIGEVPSRTFADLARYIYEVRNTVNDVVTSDTLYLLQINPDNSSSSTILSATTQNETQYPGNIIPDGNGGVLATWSVSVVQGTQLTYPYQAVDVSGGIVGTLYNLPFSPQSVDITKQPVLVSSAITQNRPLIIT